MPSIRERIVDLAASHHGFVTTSQVRELGIDPAQLRLLAARGQLEHRSRGVYRVPGTHVCEHDDLAEAVAWSQGRGVVSHGSALYLHGLRANESGTGGGNGRTAEPVTITVSPHRFPRKSGADRVEVRRGQIPPADVTHRFGIATTTVARALKDCVSTGIHAGELPAIVARAAAAGMIDRHHASSILDGEDGGSGGILGEPRTRRSVALAALRMRSADAPASLSQARLAVLQSFLRLVVTDGYGGVTLRRLASDLGMKAPSLYSHFPGGREEIAAAALRWNCFDFALSAVRSVDGITDPDDFFDALVRNHARQQFGLVQNDMFDLILASDRISNTLPQAVRDEVVGLSDVYRKTLIAAALDAGFTGDVVLAVNIATTVLDGVSTWTRHHPTMEHGDVADAALHTVRTILSTPPPSTKPARSVSIDAALGPAPTSNL